MLKQSLFLLFNLFFIFFSSCPVYCEAIKNSLDSHGETIKHAGKQQDNHVKPAYYYDAKHGWYWYEKKLKPEKKQALIKKQTIHNYTYNQLWNMYPDDFQKLLKKSMKLAVQQPSEQNVLRYLVYQDIARRKSTAFASVMQYVGQKHPEFSNEDVYPITSPGRVALADMRLNQIDQKLTTVSDRFALIVFSQPGCKFCEAQRSILKYFIRSYNWTVRIIDINERPELSARFGVEQTPTIVLIKKQSQDYLPISTGVISLSELKTRLYKSIRIMQNETTPEQWFLYDHEKNKGSDPLKILKAKN